MARRVISIALVVFLFAFAFVPSGYCDDPVKKLGRGLCNIGTFPFELCLQTSRVNDTDGPMAACTWGILKGLGMSGIRLLVGVYETVTFPIPQPKNYAPILTDPEFMFQDQNW
ncbi:MAG: exosortase system-associated protein, TIGR04073 family [Candidatus Omnitrophica bacterium]|jgi:putative exosortase-associated protein (TIGR04073 family)|nr:exosortase system-associated protein, TIGR04073 family [Candidatus Omnitrophota bacterium]